VHQVGNLYICQYTCLLDCLLRPCSVGPMEVFVSERAFHIISTSQAHDLLSLSSLVTTPLYPITYDKTYL